MLGQNSLLLFIPSAALIHSVAWKFNYLQCSVLQLGAFEPNMLIYPFLLSEAFWRLGVTYEKDHEAACWGWSVNHRST